MNKKNTEVSPGDVPAERLLDLRSAMKNQGLGRGGG